MIPGPTSHWLGLCQQDACFCLFVCLLTVFFDFFTSQVRIKCVYFCRMFKVREHTHTHVNSGCYCYCQDVCVFRQQSREDLAGRNGETTLEILRISKRWPGNMGRRRGKTWWRTPDWWRAWHTPGTKSQGVWNVRAEGREPAVLGKSATQLLQGLSDHFLLGLGV